VEETHWKQVTIAYPGQSRQERERQAVAHLIQVLPAAEAAGLITSWWFMRKGPWRIRYLPADTNHGPDPIHRLLTGAVTWTSDIYEPEAHAFGGPNAMDAAHTLFHHDSRHLLGYLHHHPTDRRERTLILCTALMRAAGLDLEEQPAPDPDTWTAFTNRSGTSSPLDRR
jgi:thiopeptide-type bacteriocin biosynthesis protein